MTPAGLRPSAASTSGSLLGVGRPGAGRVEAGFAVVVGTAGSVGAAGSAAGVVVAVGSVCAATGARLSPPSSTPAAPMVAAVLR